MEKICYIIDGVITWMACSSTHCWMMRSAMEYCMDIFIWVILSSVAILTVQRHCYNDQPMYTRTLKLFPYFVYPVAVTEFSSTFT